MKQNTQYIAVGRVTQAHGLEGWLKVMVYSGQPERFDSLKTLYLENRQGMAGYILEDAVIHNDVPVLKLRGIDTREAAKSLVKCEVFVPVDQQIDLPEGMYFIHELVGLKVFDNKSDFLGTVEEVLTAAGSDIYVVRNQEQEILIPAVSEFVRKVDIDGGRIDVRLIEGMRDAN